MNFYLKAFLPFIIWSFFGPVLNTSSFTAFQNIFLMAFFAIIWILLIYLFKGELFRLREIRLSKIVLFFAAVSGVSSVMWLSSLTIIPVAQALFLFASLPIFALFIEMAFFKQNPKLLQSIAIVLGLFGIIVILSNELFMNKVHFLSIGSVLVLLSAFLGAVQGFLVKRVGVIFKPEIIIFIVALSQVLLTAPFAFKSSWYFDGYSIFGTIFLSIFSTIVAFNLYIRVLMVLKVSTVRLIGYTEVLLGSLWGVVFLSQSLLPITIIGGFFILLASYLAVKSEK